MPWLLLLLLLLSLRHILSITNCYNSRVDNKITGRSADAVSAEIARNATRQFDCFERDFRNFAIAEYYDPVRLRHVDCQDTNLLCQFTLLVALSDHEWSTNAVDRQTDWQTLWSWHKRKMLGYIKHVHVVSLYVQSYRHAVPYASSTTLHKQHMTVTFHNWATLTLTFWPHFLSTASDCYGLHQSVPNLVKHKCTLSDRHNWSSNHDSRATTHRREYLQGAPIKTIP